MTRFIILTTLMTDAESSKGNDDESFSQPIEASPQTKPANDKPPEAAGVEGDFKSVREERAELGERKPSVSESVTSSQGSYSGRYKASKKGKSSRTVDNRASHKKIQKIESHIITLAQSVAHISSEMKSNSAIYLQLESLSAEISSIKQILEAAGLLEPLTEVKDKLSQKTDNSLIDNKAQKLNKLTKFFGQEPPLMRLFLKDLGYEKYSTMFENEKIGLLELPYMTEEALKSIGIPLGPRTRILQEASTINQTSKTQPPVRNGHANNLSSVNKLSSHSSLASKPPIHSKSKKKSRKEHSNQ
ncbi:hypothetical protein EB796_024324 [Bugula neritina]|uniref:SAM domain-containing protein n=1 Tax=Bugula neritina TaxID=10212 RepID=A0A7J7IU29_BUGNE|nr:hypothetical protein EB796_024324 [Bugula neritina]